MKNDERYIKTIVNEDYQVRSKSNGLSTMGVVNFKGYRTRNAQYSISMA